MKRKLALFDFDDTMIKGDSISTLVRQFVKQGHMSLPYLMKTLWATLQWKMGKVPVEVAKSMSLSPLNKMGQEQVEQYCRAFVKDHLVPNLYQDAVDKMIAHHEAGDLVLLVSASPNVYLQHLKSTLPVDDILATQSNQAHLVTLNVVREEKNRQIMAWLNARGIEADWEASSAYGDSANDLPMLGMVGKPHLVNPKPRTRELGKGIPVLHWK